MPVSLLTLHRLLRYRVQPACSPSHAFRPQQWAPKSTSIHTVAWMTSWCWMWPTLISPNLRKFQLAAPQALPHLPGNCSFCGRERNIKQDMSSLFYVCQFPVYMLLLVAMYVNVDVLQDCSAFNILLPGEVGLGRGGGRGSLPGLLAERRGSIC